MEKRFDRFGPESVMFPAGPEGRLQAVKWMRESIRLKEGYCSLRDANQAVNHYGKKIGDEIVFPATVHKTEPGGKMKVDLLNCGFGLFRTDAGLVFLKEEIIGPGESWDVQIGDHHPDFFGVGCVSITPPRGDRDGKIVWQTVPTMGPLTIVGPVE